MSYLFSFHIFFFFPKKTNFLKANIPNCENKSKQKFISLRPGISYQISNAYLRYLRHIFTSATLIAGRLKSFNCRPTVRILIHIKYVKNANHLGIVRKKERTHKNIPANINRYSSWKFGLQLLLLPSKLCLFAKHYTVLLGCFC